jgi:FtsH-binding integral membrane protein
MEGNGMKKFTTFHKTDHIHAYMALSPTVPQPSQGCWCALIACWFYYRGYQKGYPKQALFILLLFCLMQKCMLYLILHQLDHMNLATLRTICEAIACQ